MKKIVPTDRIDTSYFDYLINMSLRNLTKERREDILKEQKEKHEKLEALEKKSVEDLYEDDLDHFESEYEKVKMSRYFLLPVRKKFRNVSLCQGDGERTSRRND